MPTNPETTRSLPKKIRRLKEAGVRFVTKGRPTGDVSADKHPRAVHTECLRFIRGTRKPHGKYISRKAIGGWLHYTPAEAVDAALADLVAEGAVSTTVLPHKIDPVFKYEHVERAKP